MTTSDRTLDIYLIREGSREADAHQSYFVPNPTIGTALRIRGYSLAADGMNRLGLEEGGSSWIKMGGQAG